MAEESPQSGGPGPFEMRTIRDLVGLMGRHDLAELELKDGERSIRLKRNVPVLTAVPVAAPPVSAPAVVAPVAAAVPVVAAKPVRHLLEIKSPTPGTFYAQDKPGSPAFVQVGTKVNATTVVCVIEAMKVFNHVTAERAGTIEAIVIGNDEEVDAGQMLMSIV